MKVTQSLSRRERRAIHKLGHTARYRNTLWIFKTIFSPITYFVALPFHTAKKVYGVISFSIYKVFGLKVAYVDDFIVHKKLRGKWHAKELFQTVEEQVQQKNCDYILLFSDKKRKASHKFYKKMWLTIIGFWVGIAAFKKIHNKK